MKKTYYMGITIGLIFSLNSACSIYKAATQPGPAPISDVVVGMPRIQVLAMLGTPKFSDVDPQGRKRDMIEFQSGLNQASKLRILPYAAADFFTIGLAEFILWPIELSFLERATCVAVVTYDQSEKVEDLNLTQTSGVQGC